MMFLFDIAFAVELIAIAFGVGLLIWSYRSAKGGTRALGKVFGYLITIAACLVFLGTLYHGHKFWNAGYLGGQGGAQVTINKR